MNKKNVFIISVLTLIFSLVSIIPAFASEQSTKNDLIGLDEFVSSLENVCSKYGRKIEVLDSSNYTPITRKEFELYLKDVEKNAKSLMQSNFTTFPNLEQSKNETFNTTIVPNATMPINLFHSGEYQVKGGLPVVPSSALIKFSASATYDANRRNYISYKPGKWYVSRSSNLEGITYTQRYWNLTNDRKTLIANLAGEARFVYTIPVTNIVIRDTTPFSHHRPYNGR